MSRWFIEVGRRGRVRKVRACGWKSSFSKCEMMVMDDDGNVLETVRIAGTFTSYWGTP